MNPLQESIFMYEGKQTIVKVSSGKMRGLLGYFNMKITDDYTVVGRISVLPTHMALVNDDTPVIDNECLFDVYSLDSVVMNMDTLEMQLSQISVQFLNPIDFVGWKSYFQWLLHPMNVLRNKSSTFRFISKDQKVNSNLFVFRKYFTIDDWKKSIQINNRLPYKSMMEHYTLGKQIFGLRDPQKHCFAREELNKQYYLQDNWEYSRIRRYIVEVDPACADSAFHVYHFGKYYKLKIENLEGNSRVCPDWSINPYCCCEYVYYSSDNTVHGLPFSMTILSFRRDKEEMLSTLYSSNHHILYKYCTHYLELFKSTPERMNNYFEFLTGHPRIVERILGSSFDRSLFRKTYVFEELLKYSMCLFEISIKKIERSKTYTIKEALNEKIFFDLSKIRNMDILTNEFHKLSPDEMNKRCRWYSTPTKHLYLLITDDVYEVKFMCQTAVNFCMLTFLSVPGILKNTNPHFLESTNRHSDYIDSFIVALEASSDFAFDINVPTTPNYMAIEVYVHKIIRYIRRTAYYSRISYTLCGSQVYVYAICLSLVRGYSIDYILWHILTRLSMSIFYLSSIKIAIDVLNDLLLFMQFIFGPLHGFIILHGKENINPTSIISSVQLFIVFSKKCSASLFGPFSEACAMRIFPHYNIKMFNRVIKYGRILEYTNEWLQLTHFCMVELRLQDKSFSYEYLSLHLLVMNRLITFYNQNRMRKEMSAFILRYESMLVLNIRAYLNSHAERTTEIDIMHDAVEATILRMAEFEAQYNTEQYSHYIKRIRSSVHFVMALSVLSLKYKGKYLQSRLLKLYTSSLRNILNFYMLFYIHKHEFSVEYAELLAPFVSYLQSLNRELADRCRAHLSKHKIDEIWWALKKLPIFSNTLFNLFISDVIINISPQFSEECKRTNITPLQTYIRRWFELKTSLPDIEDDKELLYSILTFYYPKQIKK